MADRSQPPRPEGEQPISSAYGPPSTAPGYPQEWEPTGGATPAEWWRRLIAIILDGLILSMPYLIISFLLGVETTEIDPFTDEITIHFGALAAMTIVSLAISCTYSGVLDGGIHGATVGKMALRIQVRDATTGAPIGFARAALRRLIYTLLFYAFGVPGLINGLSPLWDRRRQAWHDKAVDSLVVNAPRPS